MFAEALAVPSALLWLAVLLIVVIGVGIVIGTRTTPDSWYRALRKPSFNPPDWVFGPVWLVLYVLIALAGWAVVLPHPAGPLALLWYVQMLLNWAWSPVWFRLHQPWVALLVVLLLLADILVFIALGLASGVAAAWLFVPYALWVAFASVLNLSVAWLNR